MPYNTGNLMLPEYPMLTPEQIQAATAAASPEARSLAEMLGLAPEAFIVPGAPSEERTAAGRSAKQAGNLELIRALAFLGGLLTGSKGLVGASAYLLGPMAAAKRHEATTGMENRVAGRTGEENAQSSRISALAHWLTAQSSTAADQPKTIEAVLAPQMAPIFAKIKAGKGGQLTPGEQALYSIWTELAAKASQTPEQFYQEFLRVQVGMPKSPDAAARLRKILGLPEAVPPAPSPEPALAPGAPETGAVLPQEAVSMVQQQKGKNYTGPVNIYDSVTGQTATWEFSKGKPLRRIK